jgi:hypothetical protein
MISTNAEYDRIPVSHRNVSRKVDTTNLEALHPDKCVGSWTEDHLIGRCFGLKLHSEFPTLKNIHFIDSAQHCKQLCCDLGKDCSTWQYWTGNKICKMGDIISMKSDSSLPHCESNKPLIWSGRRVNPASTDELTTQCSGLEPVTTIKSGLSHCSEACLEKEACRVWQYHPLVGCFVSTSLDFFCDPYTGSFEGGRKKVE